MNNFHMREGKVEFRWKRWRNKKRQEVSSCLMVLFSGVVLLGAGGVALAGPTGGQITGGSGTITNPNGTTTNINQQSNVLNINWQDFSIGAGETVNFYQPGSTSVAINRVIGGVPSYLAGALNANGRVFILNSAGITFTGTSQVNVGALLATTAMTVNGDPTLTASYSGTGYGAVINQGSISVSNGGFAILAAPYVQNTGFIKADLGTIALAGTNQFTLDLSGTGLINFVVPAGAVEQIVSDGKAVGVDNSGTLQARSGQVVISANVASEVINAVVNLNGIVDADAFAPNGQGGSVLVTAAGDVNVGGHVTAKGSGAGNGGQIVTKAGGADLIGQMAYVSAAGGATGKGGFIEVSGKQVGLHGTIDPGSGGSLYIDPNNIHVVQANFGQGTLVGSNQVGSVIGSDFIENQLHGGANVNLVADHNVFFDVLADDHQLVGGNGNLNIVATNGNITFAGTNDAIVQGAGFIHMNANGGNIGSNGHAMTLITGVAGAAGAGVTQAGDIVLTATGDIHVHNVQVKSSGGSSLTAKFSANAGHNFIASGDISVTANAHGSGHEQATASVNIFAHNNINVRNVAVVAQAADTDAGGGQSASAFANLRLNAQASSVAARNVLVDASAFNVADREVNGRALGSIQANKNIDINGSINVAAAGVGDSSDDSSAHAKANLLLSAVTGHVNVTKDVIVDALAKTLNSSAQATASANINANTGVTINGNVALTASAIGSSVDATQDHAFANLLVHANAGIAINHDVTVAANAHGFGTDRSDDANASAAASANITANNIDIGGHVAVTANAVQSGDHDSSSFASARANLLMHANVGHVNVGGDVTVDAFGQQGGSSKAFANALANIFANNGSLAVGGNVEVEASANNLGSSVDGAQASANLLMCAHNGNVTVGHDIIVEGFAHSHGTGSATGLACASVFAHNNITVNGNVQVLAQGENPNSEASSATAIANLKMLASHGSLTINHSVIVKATASSGGKFATPGHAKATAEADLLAQNQITIGSNVVVTANAQQTGSFHGSGGQFAIAVANLQMEASHSGVRVNKNIDVEASANGLASAAVRANALANIFANTDIVIGTDASVVANAHHAASSSGARALANLHFDAAHGSVNAGGTLAAVASAHSTGASSAHANALGSVFANTSIKVGGVKVIANAEQATSDGTNALASANANLDAAHGSVVIARNLVVQATAHDAATGQPGSAIAHATADVFANNLIRVGGDVAVSANASAHGNLGEAAIAFLNLDAAHSSVNVGGNVDVRAFGLQHGPSSAHANANAQLFGNTNVRIGKDVIVSANADQADGAGSSALACASLNIDAAHGSVNIGRNVTVHGVATASGVSFASAKASVNIFANSKIFIGGNVSVSATGDQDGAAGSFANAIANLNMQAHSGSINIGHNLRVFANVDNSGHSNAQANATVNLLANNGLVVGGNVMATATAFQNAGGSFAHASANVQLLTNQNHIDVAGNVRASANAVSKGSESALAFALVNANAPLGDVLIHGAVIANAHASANSVGTGIGAQALGSINIHGDPVVLGSIVEHVTASSHGTDFANAQANVHVNGATVTVNHNIDILAAAHQFRNSGGDSALASADLELKANNTLTVTGNVDVHGTAIDSGHNNAVANVLANFFDNGLISLAGQINVFANALQNGTHGSDAHADANLHVITNQHINIGGPVLVNAHAISHGSESALANADLQLHGDQGVTANNTLTVNAFASANQHANSIGASADASMNIVANNFVHLAGLGGHATASSHGHDFANALMNVHITGDSVSISGPATFLANAVDANVLGSGAQAAAQVLVHDSGGSGNLHINNTFSVTASANDHASTNHANALANVQLTGHEANTHAVVLGNINVRANAFDANGKGLTLADAELLVNASSGANGGIHLHSAHVNATANEAIGSNNAHAQAVGNAFFNAANVVQASGGDVFVYANAVDGSSANANALLHVVAGHLIFSGTGTVGAQAQARAINVNDQAHALANVNLTAMTGNASVGLHVLLEGLATATFAQAHSGGNVINNITATADVFVNANHNVLLHDVNVTADAENWGDNSAKASASFNVAANNVISLGGHMVVNAQAVDHNSNGNGVTYAAVANAHAFFNGTSITSVFGTSHGIDIEAHAIDNGHNAAQAIAALVINAAVKNVTLGGITIDAVAHDTDTLAGGVGAVADASFIDTNALVNFTIGSHGINLLADASSQGTAKANAKALLKLHSKNIGVTGPINVNAQANGGALVLQATVATASLDLLANTITVGHAIDVKANAHNLGSNSHALATANAAINGTHGSVNAVNLNDVTVEAYAFDHNAQGAETLANAQLLIEDTVAGGGVGFHNVVVLASADQEAGTSSGTKVVALANLDIEAAGVINGHNGVAALAFAHDPGGTNATASANVALNAQQVQLGVSHNTFHIHGSGGTVATASADYGVLAAAAAVYSGSDDSTGHGAHALANVNINAHHNNIIIGGGVDLLALAIDHGGQAANATANLTMHASEDITINGSRFKLRVPGSGGSNFASIEMNDGVFLGAVAVGTGETNVQAHGNAQGNINAVNNVTINHGVFDLAAAVATSGSSARANANLEIQAGLTTKIGAGQLSLFLSSKATSSLNTALPSNLLSMLPGGGLSGNHTASFAVFDAALAFDGGTGTSFHANALAQVNIDPNIVQINGPVDVIAIAFDHSGAGATANANLFIHANHVAIGTESGHDSILVAAVAVEQGSQGASVNAHANARITANNASSGAVSINDITVFAFAENPSANAASLNESAIAHMLLQASNGGVRVDDVNVAAAASLQGSVSANALASASAAIRAKKHINVNGDITVSALANTVSSAGDADASAILKLKTTGSTGFIDVEGHILVNAVAEGGGVSSAIANATANIQGNAGVTLNDGVDVEANADETNSSGTDARACANLDIDAASGSVTINGPVVANAQAETEGSGNASAYALTEIDAGSGDVNVTGNISVTANAKESASSSSVGRGAHANANLAVSAGGSGTQSINLAGNITVNAQAQGDGGESGSPGDSVTANAEAQIIGGGQHTNININGDITVTANALYSGSDSQMAVANANLDIQATSGSVTMRSNVLVNAVAEEDGTASASANAQVKIAAENAGGSSAGNVTITGNVTVLANALLDDSSGQGAHACANLAIIASSDNIVVNGNVDVEAKARGDGSSSEGGSVTADANVQIGGIEGGFTGAIDSVFFNGFITVAAQASYTGDDEQQALACANLDIDATSGQVRFNGGVNVVASALDEGSGQAVANASIEIGAENGGLNFDSDVSITGNINIKANAQKTGDNTGGAFACANLSIVSDDGNVFISGGITDSASAFAEGSENASAFAIVGITASHSIVMTGGDIIARANATYADSTDAAAVASAVISVHARNVALRGVRGSANAHVSSESAADAQAVTNIAISAGSNLSVGPDGVLAFAGASAGSDQGQGSANAQIALDAGTNGVGNIFVRGNAIALAQGVGGGTDNIAHANVHLAAGGATSSFSGGPANFGNITIVGNVGAFAFADATNDEATASVEIFAHNNLLIVGADPIASARVGPSGGTTFAFRQAHFTTNDGTNFGPGGGALADIDIRAGGFVAVFPTSSLSHVEKLYSLPTDDPTLNSSLGLTIIPLSVDGEDCGVLGIAGKDQAAINKALGCHHKPINVSDLTDTGP